MGASRCPGRWNKEGERAVYTSFEVGTAALEVLSYLDRATPPLEEFSLMTISFDASQCLTSPETTGGDDTTEMFVPPASETVRTGGKLLGPPQFLVCESVEDAEKRQGSRTGNVLQPFDFHPYLFGHRRSSLPQMLGSSGHSRSMKSPADLQRPVARPIAWM